jgi:RNA polymerase sigma-70 factor (ECF subfamily)
MNSVLEKNTILKFAKADKHAFQLIFDFYFGIMKVFGNRYLRNSHDAEDIVQEAFIELWNQKEKFSNANQVKAFLYLTIRNKCLNRIKHLKIENKYLQSIDKDKSEESFFEEEVIRAEFVDQLRNAIDKLSEQRKRIILLNMKGLKNQEIANELKISINTVKLQKKIAYKQLRENLSSSLLTLLFLINFFS